MKTSAFLSLVISLVSASFAEQEPIYVCGTSLERNFVETMTGPDSVGRAGMVAVLLPETEARPGLLLEGGGSNFPHAKPGAKTPEERGEKVFYSDVRVAGTIATGDNHRDKKEKVYGLSVNLPRPIAYAAFVPTDKGMLIAGGCNAEGHTAKVSRVDLVDDELRVEALPDLPRTLAYPAFAVVGNKVYVMGGQEKADSTTCLNSCFMLDLADINAGWQELAPMPGARMLAAAGVVDGVIYVMGGCSLAPDAKGNGQRTYLKDVLCYDPGSNTWAKVGTEMPETNVGMANPLPSVDSKLYVVGGDPGNYYRASLAGNAPAEHPGQSRDVYSYTPATGEWKKLGELPIGVATFPIVPISPYVFETISGETHPGIRTPYYFLIDIRK